MTPEEKARKIIDGKLEQSGWIIQDLAMVNPMASLGVVVREYPTSTGPVDYALFVDGKPVGVVEAKKDDAGENITVVEGQSGRYANSKFSGLKIGHLQIWIICLIRMNSLGILSKTCKVHWKVSRNCRNS